MGCLVGSCVSFAGSNSVALVACAYRKVSQRTHKCWSLTHDLPQRPYTMAAVTADRLAAARRCRKGQLSLPQVAHKPLHYLYHRVLLMFMNFTRALPLLIKLSYIRNSFIFTVPFNGVLVRFRGEYGLKDSTRFLM